MNHDLDEFNSIAPSFNLRTGSTKVAFTRKCDRGSLVSEYTPNDKLQLTWVDGTDGGVWTTRAEVPLHDSKKGTKLSLSRSWMY